MEENPARVVSLEFEPLTTVIILAAGAGERIRDSEKGLPKPLVRVGGLHLLERSILNMRAAGLLSFRIVLGYRGDEIRTILDNLTTLKNLDIQFITNPDFEKGNGSSLAYGVRGFEGPFLLTMADHLFGGDTIRQFIEKSRIYPGRGQLATDANIDAVFDLPDATKVLSDNGKIVSIGKEIPKYNEIDTGLFFFPRKLCKEIDGYFAGGAHSVSQIIGAINAAHGFYATRLENAFWQDVDTPEMKIEAERRLYRSLIKPTDGPVSRHLNRLFSLPTSKVLIRFGVAPNSVTTFVFLLSLVAAYFAARPSYLSLLLGGFLFQVASILDGCDGEISRLTFKGTAFGAWYDTITDNIRYCIFFCALGFGAYRLSHAPIYLWAIGFFAIMMTAMVIMSSAFLMQTRSKGTHLVVLARVEQLTQSGYNPVVRFLMKFRVLAKQDVVALIILGLCLIGQATIMFWAGVLAIPIMLYSIWRATRSEKAPEAPTGALTGSPG